MSDFVEMPDAIDPTNIPQAMSSDQLEWWILFGICVANKPAKITEAKMRNFMNPSSRWWELGTSPFGKVRTYIDEGVLGRELRRVRFGQYTRINKAFRHAVNLDIQKLTVEVLEMVPGIGPKTARMIILYARPGETVVPLDTHILKFLKTLGIKKVPKSTPPAGPTYRRLELAFVAEANRRRMTVRELDTQVWSQYAGYNDQQNVKVTRA